jgi:hypothetical protein
MGLDVLNVCALFRGRCRGVIALWPCCVAWGARRFLLVALNCANDAASDQREWASTPHNAGQFAQVADGVLRCHARAPRLEWGRHAFIENERRLHAHRGGAFDIVFG